MAKKRDLLLWLRSRNTAASAAALISLGSLLGSTSGLLPAPANAYVALMAGQKARALNGQFNRVPVLHSNQPEEVEGPGILINTAPGSAYSSENGRQIGNAEFTFNGEFGIHIHHKYFPPYRAQIAPGSRRTELTLGLILMNPGYRPVHLRFSAGAIRNSFEAPYLANSMTGVRPLGPRPWNTGPGDATAVQLLRGRLDPRLSEVVTIPPRSRVVLFSKDLPALGIANALLRGHSDGPFQMAVVAASNPQDDGDLFAVLDQAQLASGRVYLNRVTDIQNRVIFSRVGGVALGDAFEAKLSHNLLVNGPLHVPLTSTHRHNFGTKDIQINPLASRMVDSSLDNVGTYGVRFDVDLLLQGEGPYDLVLSHPTASGGKPFTAFRGSFQIQTSNGTQDVHVVLRSGQSLSLASLNLLPGQNTPLRVSFVYPADATPGHLLSVVPSDQLSRVLEIERQAELARAEAERASRNRRVARVKPKRSSKPVVAATTTTPAEIPALPELDEANLDEMPSAHDLPLTPPPSLPAVTLSSPLVQPESFRDSTLNEPVMPPRTNQSLIDRYQQALEAQQDMMRGLMTR